jgi:uncharacterized protein YukE
MVSEMRIAAGPKMTTMMAGKMKSRRGKTSNLLDRARSAKAALVPAGAGQKGLLAWH